MIPTQYRNIIKPEPKQFSNISHLHWRPFTVIVVLFIILQKCLHWWWKRNSCIILYMFWNIKHHLAKTNVLTWEVVQINWNPTEQLYFIWHGCASLEAKVYSIIIFRMQFYQVLIKPGKLKNAKIFLMLLFIGERKNNYQPKRLISWTKR